MNDRSLWYVSVRSASSKYSVQIVTANELMGPEFKEEAPTIDALQRLLLALRPRWGAELHLGVPTGVRVPVAKVVYGESGESPPQVVLWGIKELTSGTSSIAFILQNQSFEAIENIVSSWREWLAGKGSIRRRLTGRPPEGAL